MKDFQVQCQTDEKYENCIIFHQHFQFDSSKNKVPVQRRLSTLKKFLSAESEIETIKRVLVRGGAEIERKLQSKRRRGNDLLKNVSI